MILEVAILNVVPNQSDEFLTAFAEAEPILSSMDGYLNHQLQRCIETPSRFILMVSTARSRPWNTTKLLRHYNKTPDDLDTNLG